MPIRPKFTFEEIRQHCSNFLDAVEEAQVQMMEYLGEKCVIEARTNHGYQDQTGALTSSIGFMVFKNGIALRENFEKQSPLKYSPDFSWRVRKDGSTSLKKTPKAKVSTPEEGLEKGKALAEKIGSENTEGLMLVVVAGMNYALYVEAKGYNVLASAEHLAEQEFPRMVADLKTDIKNAV